MAKLAGVGSMLGLPVGPVTLAGLGVGAVATVAVAELSRPLLVETVRVSYKLKDLTVRAWQETKSAAAGIKADALAPRSQVLQREIDELRSEVTSLRAQLAKRSA